MKQQDILILLKLLSLKDSNCTQVQIADALLISRSEISEGLERLKISGLVDHSKTKVQKLAAREFLVHGLRYVFPPKLGTKVRGIATAHSASPIMEHLKVGDEMYVWKAAKGTKRGIEIEPIYKTVPKIVDQDPDLYELLVIVDTLRIGRVRELEIAIAELDKKLK